MGSVTELQRDLGLTSVVAIAMGAMIGSGIFILPGLAMAEAGPAVILAFVLAAVLVVPAAISIAELGTAIPEAGGDYVFIKEGMGPAAGTIAGLGTWLMLMFKGALALVGGMFYLEVLIALPNVETVAVIIGTILIVVNIVGVKQTGGLQTIMVVVMVAILALFVLFSITNVQQVQYEPFFSGGTGGLLTATAMVLVSYAGVTKVVAVAEEIENPGRNLPLGLLLSMGITTLLYALIVFILVGIIEGEALAGSNIPMVDAVEPFFGYIGAVLIVLAAMLALVSTANAGILTASRYPFALSRDKLLPAFFGDVSARLHTPVKAIAVTGGAMLAIVVFLPVEDIAKTAGSFQIIVYILVNAVLIVFRVQSPAWYTPDYRAPLYPWVQIFGIVSGIGILSVMDWLPLIGGVAIIVLGIAWYMVYGRRHVADEGMVGKALAKTMDLQPEPTGAYRVVVPVGNRRNLRDLVRMAAASAAPHEEPALILMHVVSVPEQTALLQEVEVEVSRMNEQRKLLEEAAEAAEAFGIPYTTRALVGRDVSRAILNVIRREEAHEVVLGWKGERKRRDVILGTTLDPVIKKALCEVTLVKVRHASFGDTVVLVGGGPHTKVAVERAREFVASEEEATLSLVNVQSTAGGDPPELLRAAGHDLINEAAAAANLADDAYHSRVVVADDVYKSLIEVASDYQTVCIGATRSTQVERALFGTIPEQVGERATATVVIVRARDQSLPSLSEAMHHIGDRLLGRAPRYQASDVSDSSP